ncbi:er degradation-enhancing alpha-mannosidase-like protein 2 [Holotrichia oblita]|uniref:Er degradation-enhancing alpha-mannosidase-like protein 2 n=1 Tax=Holotrichia oblita TaxID=644536 RepID=A0ACB9TV40_HOLOL|nr:er degradation-enhancing alpha-mannosidase-like protein 2 [Holotrichia oblita]
MKYISQGPMLLDVHMHRPHTNSRNYMDALLAFWPGLQVLKGDIKPAVETHEMLYQVMQRHKFIPEAFTTDFQVHWGNHPLRPEFLESTYFLYGATGDPYYLEVGKNVLKSLQKYARVPCGYAAVNDVRTGRQEDRMDSFVLAETFKYLYLLFADPDDHILNLDEFIFTTEGHLLPLTLANYKNHTSIEEDLEDYEFARICPNSFSLFPESVRKPLKNMVDGVCPRRMGKRRLTAQEFSASNVNHLKIIKDMGISIIALNDGRVQLLHTFSAARSPADAEEGLLFMQEMVELSKIQQQQSDASPQAVSFSMKYNNGEIQTITVPAGPSHFGKNLKNDDKVVAKTIIIHPFRGCADLLQGNTIKGKIAIMERGDCMFVEKARRVQKAGAVGAIIIDNAKGSSAESSPLFSMSGDGTDDIKIPTVFLFSQDASKLLLTLSKDPFIEVTISEWKSDTEVWPPNEEESVFQKLKLSVQEFLNKHTGIAFTKTIIVGSFQADVGLDKIRIIYEKMANEDIPTEEVTNHQWSQIRKGLLNSIVNSDTHELFVPVNILRIYYQTLSGATNEDLKDHDIFKQTEWLLKELSIEYHRKDDDLIKENSDLINFISNSDAGAVSENLEKNRKKLEKLNTIFQALSQIEKDVIDELKKKAADDLIITDESVKHPEKVIITQDSLDGANSKSDSQSDRKWSNKKDEL